MAFINKEVFQQKFAKDKPYTMVDGYDGRAWSNGGPLRTAITAAMNRNNPKRETVWADKVDRESALACLAEMREFLVNRGCFGGKVLRPWEIDTELCKRLDRSQNWWGFEFETGYQTAGARGQVLGHVWDTWDNVAYDNEGEGNYPCEITFAPQEQSKFEDGTAQANQFMNWLAEQSKLTYRSREAGIGTHFNLSTPGMEKGDASRNSAEWMNLTVSRLPNEMNGKNVRSEMFGRSTLYGGWFPQAGWIEGKLFRTTYKADEWAKYLKVCKALTLCLETLTAVNKDKANSWHHELRHIPYVYNLYEIYKNDAAPEVRWTDAQYRVTSDSSAISGNKGRDVINDATPQTKEEYEVVLAKLRREKERAAAEARRKEERKREAPARLAERRRLYELDKSRPAYVAEDAEWCDHCKDWHYDGDDMSLFDDPDDLYGKE